MDLLDYNFITAAFTEAHRAGLLIVCEIKNDTGSIFQQIWLDPIYTYCGAGT